MNYSLYIHIPFCKSKCSYCKFCSYTDIEESVQRKYIEALQKELDFSALQKFNTIYIGGGTPTVLSMSSLEKLISMINLLTIKTQMCPIEITIEANPKTANFYKLKFLRENGINRLSIGAQSFDDSHLTILNRAHNSYDIYNIYEAAIKAGFVNINLDLIFGIPTQTLKDWLKTLEMAVKLKPKHISTYNLQIEKGTKLFDEYNINYDEAQSDLEYKMFRETIAFLKSNGYVQYEISNFCLPGFECQHNINYWENGEYLGLGVSAASHINGGRKVNTTDIKKYIKNPLLNRKIKKQSLKIEMSETIIMNLRMIKGLNVKDFKEKFKRSIFDIFQNEIEELIITGLLKFKQNHLSLTKKGIFLANEVMQKFV